MYRYRMSDNQKGWSHCSSVLLSFLGSFAHSCFLFNFFSISFHVFSVPTQKQPPSITSFWETSSSRLLFFGTSSSHFAHIFAFCFRSITQKLKSRVSRNRTTHPQAAHVTRPLFNGQQAAAISFIRSRGENLTSFLRLSTSRLTSIKRWNYMEIIIYYFNPDYKKSLKNIIIFYSWIIFQTVC